MPVDMTRYPANWKDIRTAIQQRAGDACEWCSVPNGALIEREPGTDRYEVWGRIDAHGDLAVGDALAIDAALVEGVNIVRVVCTTAHLGTDHPDGTPGDKHDKMDCRPENLAFLCQRCHLLYDLDDHVRNAAETRRRKRIEAGQTTFLEVAS